MSSDSTIRGLSVLVAALTVALAPPVVRAETSEEIAREFQREIVPFLRLHCATCHGGDEPEGGIRLDRFTETANIQEHFEQWERVQSALADGLMPPEDEPQPNDEERGAVLAAIERQLQAFDCETVKPGRVTLRRLNRAEYNNTIRDLLGIDFQPANDFPSDDVGEGFDNMGDVLSLPPLLLEKYLAAAEQIVARALADEAAAGRIFVASSEASDAVRQNLTQFAGRAFRRPATSVEVDRLLGLIKYTRDQGASEDDAFAAALQAVLASPHFLFRVEADRDSDDDSPRRKQAPIRKLNDYEIAVRLSYFLWSSMPDEELFQLAADGKLSDEVVLESQVMRMLADGKSQALVDNFAGQWLQLRDLANLEPDLSSFPDFDEELRQSMRRETEIFFASIVREDRSVLDILGADYTYVNNRLARHYGMDESEEDGFRRVALSNRRRGVLTHGSILFLTSNPTRTSPVKRGKWILDNILGEPPPPPPEGVEELEEEGQALGSMRERLEQHRSNESCAICHRRMDPIGFGLENFDAIGAWRDRDGRFEIDASGSLVGGREFAGPDELMSILVDEKREEFCRCLARKMLTYALGRGLTTADRCAIDEIMDKLTARKHRFSVLVTAIVTSEPFLLREMKGQE